jgi:hypothetical protein
MLEKQIECLEKSINEKWIPIVEGRHRVSGAKDCACCNVFRVGSFAGCGECPISIDTNNIECHGTPYYIYCELFDSYCGMKWNIFDASSAAYNYDLMFDLKAAAQMELDYLIDLRDRLKGRLYEMEQIEDARPGPGK